VLYDDVVNDDDEMMMMMMMMIVSLRGLYAVLYNSYSYM
jgi:hypothetical protein